MRVKSFLILLALLCLSFPALGSDISKGYAFSPGERNVDHTKLNNLVDAATINPGFYTDKSAITTPSGTDLALIYSGGAGGFRKITLGNLFYANPFIITNLTLDATPALDDLLMTYDVSDVSLKKTTLRQAIFESSLLINDRTNWATPGVLSTYFLAYDGGAWSKLSRSNIFYQFANFATYTNLAVHAHPTNEDTLLIFDSVAGANKQINLAGLVTNLPALTTPTNTDVFLTVNASTGIVAQVTLQMLATFLSNSIVKPAVSNVSQAYIVPEFAIPGAGTAVTNTHTLAVVPGLVHWVLVCKTAELGYVQGEEVGITAFGDYADTAVATWAYSSSSTNVVLVRRSASTQLQVPRRDGTVGAVGSNITPGNWRAKGYLRP